MRSTNNLISLSSVIFWNSHVLGVHLLARSSKSSPYRSLQRLRTISRSEIRRMTPRLSSPWKNLEQISWHKYTVLIFNYIRSFVPRIRVLVIAFCAFLSTQISQPVAYSNVLEDWSLQSGIFSTIFEIKSKRNVDLIQYIQVKPRMHITSDCLISNFKWLILYS